MASIPILILSTATRLYHSIRDIAYEDMARQALGWVPGNAMIEKSAQHPVPLKLNFEVGKKHRLNWARQRINHLPY